MNIKKMAQTINEKIDELKKTVNAKQDKDFKRLETGVELALNSLSMKKVWENKKRLFNEEAKVEESGYVVEYTYLNDKLEKPLKGIRVGEKNGSDFKEDFYQRHECKHELWLTKEGFVETLQTGLTVKTAFAESTLKREVINWDVDVFEIDEEFDYIWDINSILIEIELKMEKRIQLLDKKLEKELVSLKEIEAIIIK